MNYTKRILINKQGLKLLEKKFDSVSHLFKNGMTYKPFYLTVTAEDLPSSSVEYQKKMYITDLVNEKIEKIEIIKNIVEERLRSSEGDFSKKEKKFLSVLEQCNQDLKNFSLMKVSVKSKPFIIVIDEKDRTETLNEETISVILNESEMKYLLEEINKNEQKTLALKDQFLKGLEEATKEMNKFRKFSKKLIDFEPCYTRLSDEHSKLNLEKYILDYADLLFNVVKAGAAVEDKRKAIKDILEAELDKAEKIVTGNKNKLLSLLEIYNQDLELIIGLKKHVLESDIFMVKDSAPMASAPIFSLEIKQGLLEEIYSLEKDNSLLRNIILEQKDKGDELMEKLREILSLEVVLKNLETFFNNL